MTSAVLLDTKGKQVGEVSLEATVFGVEPNVDLMHTALNRQLANARSGSANTKTRSEVSGGGRKPWRQKGTGRARAGSIRSPLWAGGGVTFGPKPRDYSMSLPKKMRALAVRSALSAKREDMVVLKDFSIKEPKTKEVAAIFDDLKISGQKILIVLDFACDGCVTIKRAASNIKGVKVVSSDNLSVKDIIEAGKIVTTERTVKAIGERLKSNSVEAEGKGATKAKKAKKEG
ncbi:MAG: 50S ribosomal protein L4 [Candidatus Obscuribacterales bacterium]|nr:50S ribosomal protein L4 [Candidatus Obscuribacterales bacterium]